jgi:hypothetical protein
VRKLFIAVGLAAMLGGTIATKAVAESWDNWILRPVDKSTVLTFSGPVSLPGVTLPAGSYLFRFISPINSPDVLQVLSEDGTKQYAMLHTIPVFRWNAEGNPDVVFSEHKADAPAPINAWFFEQNRDGYDVGCEMIY